MHKGMSALSATAKADSRKRSCLLYPRKRTCAAHKPMSAKCQKRTWTELFDHLVGAEQDGLGYFEAERLGDFAIEDKLKLHTRSIGRSAGLAPLRILSTKMAARRKIATKSAP